MTSETAATEDSPLRQARHAAELTLAELAAKAEISIGYLSMIERGLKPPAAVCERLAAALELPEAELWV